MKIKIKNSEEFGRLLVMNNPQGKPKKIISTTKGISSYSAEYFKDEFCHRFGETSISRFLDFYIEGDMDCETVFKKYSPYMNIR